MALVQDWLYCLMPYRLSCTFNPQECRFRAEAMEALLP